MGKKAISVLLVSLALASAHLAEAQQTAKKVPRIGYLAATGPEASNIESLRFEAESSKQSAAYLGESPRALARARFS
jgi:hypothetical protein